MTEQVSNCKKSGGGVDGQVYLQGIRTKLIKKEALQAGWGMGVAGL